MGFAEQLAARVRDSSVENTNGKLVASESSTVSSSTSSFAEELKRSKAARQDKASPSTAATTPCSDTSSPDDHSITTATTQRNDARRLLIPSCNNYEDDEESVGFWDTSNYIDGGINNEKGGESSIQNVCGNENEENNDNPSDSSASPDSSNAIFGAWAEIDSLKHRVHEAEERARQECQRAEIASYELRLAMERQGICQDDATTDAPRNEAALCEAAVTSARDEVRRMRNVREVVQPPKMIDQETSRATTSAEADAALQWKKRALEAEERLKHAPTSAAKQSASTITPRLEESDLVRLKNAEIEVLRSQILRLELRQEESERNEELLRSSCLQHQHHHHDDPPLVVASECTDSHPRTSAEYEFHLLRNEIRHLQNQLRTKGDNAYENNGGEEEEEDDGPSTSSWGLCCIRRTRRGYGKV